MKLIYYIYDYTYMQTLKINIIFNQFTPSPILTFTLTPNHTPTLTPNLIPNLIPTPTPTPTPILTLNLSP